MNKYRKYLKKVNRGLIIGGLLTLILIIYGIVNYTSFLSEKEEISQVAKNYIEDIFMTNNDCDDKTALKEKVYDLIDEYWVDAQTPSYFSGNTKTEFIAILDDVFNDASLVFDISSAEVDIDTHTDVYSIAEDYAEVTLSYYVSAHGMDNSIFITPASYKHLYENYPYNNNGEPTLGEFDYSASLVTLVLKKDGGKWKICGFDGYSNYNSFIPDEEVQ